jgi:glycerol-3-phosphate responsive antiterminator
MTSSYEPACLSDILEAELSAVVAHHTEMANLERDCAKLKKRGRAAIAHDDADEEPDE